MNPLKSRPATREPKVVPRTSRLDVYGPILAFLAAGCGPTGTKVVEGDSALVDGVAHHAGSSDGSRTSSEATDDTSAGSGRSGGDDSSSKALGTNTAAACGTWVLQQAASASDLDATSTGGAIDAALGFADIRGFSLRVPWTSIDGGASGKPMNTEVLDAGLAVAKAHKTSYSIRFIAGQYTPAWVFETNGAYSFTDGAGDRIPKPFSDSGAPGNPGFESAFGAAVKSLAAYCRANGIRLLHLPWYGELWDEVYDGSDVTEASGYSPSAFEKGYANLVQTAMPYAGADLAVEFPLSGVYTSPVTAGPLASATLAAAGASWSQLIFVQSNGLGTFDAAPTNLAIFNGRQMYDATTKYNWHSIYAALQASPKATYVEIYAQSFGPQYNAGLQAEVTAFAHGGNCP
jgi:hypothetical protein